MAEGAKVLVIGELQQGHLHATSAEVLAAGRELAQSTGTPLAIVLVGDDLAAATTEAWQAGADQVYAVAPADVQDAPVEVQLSACTEVCRSVGPAVVLLGRTPVGRDLAPRLACRLGVGLLQDCLRVEMDAASGRLVATRPVYGGNIMAKVRSTGTPQIAALRPKAYAPLPVDTSRTGETIAVAVTPESTTARVHIVREVRDESPGVKLEDARIVIAGGRGLGGPEPFRELQELAGMLGAAVGASRAAVDAGWVPGNYQIGLTGRTITPELYITVGISGASQHMAGCSGSKAIVAINKDREANIFREARYGVVGDWQTILPAFMEAVRRLS